MAPKGENGIFLKTPNIFEIQYVGKAKNYLNRTYRKKEKFVL